MQIPRDEVIALMRRVGLRDGIAQAQATLPDPVDTDRDADALAKVGVYRERLTELLGGSP